MIAWVDKNFVEWGQHVRGAACKLGYPSMSVEARMQDGALSVNAFKSIPLVYFPQSVELTEQVVLRMPDYLVHVAIVAYTMSDDMTRDDHARILARRLGRNVSRRTFHLWIDALHNQYEGYYRGMSDMVD